MRFQVPQFIDVKDKIFGPLTWKQFVYLAGGAGLSITFYFTLPKLIAFVLIIPVAGLSLALAFYEVNEQPFIEVLENGFNYITSPRLYVWKHREERKKVKKKPGGEKEISLEDDIPRVSNSKLEDMSWSLGVKEELGNGQKQEADVEAVTRNMKEDTQEAAEKRKNAAEALAEDNNAQLKTQAPEERQKKEVEDKATQKKGDNQEGGSLKEKLNINV